MSKAPHHQAAFINAIADEGDKKEAIKYLQETWNELCELKREHADLLMRHDLALSALEIANFTNSRLMGRSKPKPRKKAKAKYKCTHCNDTGKIHWTNYSNGQGLDIEEVDDCTHCNIKEKHNV